MAKINTALLCWQSRELKTNNSFSWVEIEASRAAGVQIVTVNRLFVDSIPIREDEILLIFKIYFLILLYYLYLKFIFPFLRSGVEAKGGIEFRHSTRNATECSPQCLNIQFPLPTPLCAGYSVKLIYDFI